MSHRAIQKLILCANNSRLELSQRHHSPRWLCEQFSNSHCSQQGLLNHPQHPSRCVCLCQVPGCCNVPSWYRQIQKCHGVERGPCEWDWEDNSTSARGMSLGSTAEAMSVVTGVYRRGNVCEPIVVPLCPLAWECIHPSFKTTMQEHLLSEITCSLEESGLPHSQSPDLSPAKHLRKLLGRHVRRWPP